MRKLKLMLAFVAISSVIALPSYAQQWSVSYSGWGSDSAHFIQQTQDGGYIVAGRTDSFGAAETDFWVLKLNLSGDVVWQKTYGWALDEIAYSVQETQDGGYIVAGRTDSFGAGDDDMWILKLNSDGTIAWQKTYGEDRWDKAYSVQETQDGGYIVAGESSFGPSDSRLRVLKLHSDGTIAWQRSYDADAGNGYSIRETSDAGYIMVGYTNSLAQWDLLVLKLNSDGTIAWQKAYEGSSSTPGYYVCPACCIQQTTDGGYIVAGDTYFDSAGQWDFWTLKLYPDGEPYSGAYGEVEWQKTYGGSNDERVRCVQQTADAGYIMAGGTNSFGAGSTDYWALKLDPDGSVVWQKTYGGISTDNHYWIQETQGGGYVIAGETNSFGLTHSWALWVSKLNEYGEIPYCRILGTSEAVVRIKSGTVVDTSMVPQESSAVSADTTVVPGDSSAIRWPVCPGLIRNGIVLKDLDANIVTNRFRPGTNIRYKVKFTVDGDPNKLYKVVGKGKAYSRYKHDGNREWIDKFDNPEKKRKKLYGGESNKVYWDRQIPEDATTGTEGGVKFTLKLKEYDQGIGSWNLLGICEWWKNKPFKIVE